MKLDTTKKDFNIGQKIYLIPLGNAKSCRNNKLEDQIKEVVIEKIGSTKIYVDNNFIKCFDMNGKLDVHNYGYLPFLSEEKAIEYIKLCNFIIDLKNLNFSGLQQEKVLKIMDFFEKENLIKKD